MRIKPTATAHFEALQRNLHRLNRVGYDVWAATNKRIWQSAEHAKVEGRVKTMVSDWQAGLWTDRSDESGHQSFGDALTARLKAGVQERGREL